MNLDALVVNQANHEPAQTRVATIALEPESALRILGVAGLHGILVVAGLSDGLKPVARVI
jgi:hypothetical protein